MDEIAFDAKLVGEGPSRRPLPKGSLERLRVNAKDILGLINSETE